MDNEKRAQKIKIFDEIILKYSRKKNLRIVMHILK